GFGRQVLEVRLRLDGQRWLAGVRRLPYGNWVQVTGGVHGRLFRGFIALCAPARTVLLVATSRPRLRRFTNAGTRRRGPRSRGTATRGVSSSSGNRRTSQSSARSSSASGKPPIAHW